MCPQDVKVSNKTTDTACCTLSTINWDMDTLSIPLRSLYLRTIWYLAARFFNFLCFPLLSFLYSPKSQGLTKSIDWFLSMPTDYCKDMKTMSIEAPAMCQIPLMASLSNGPSCPSNLDRNQLNWQWLHFIAETCPQSAKAYLCRLSWRHLMIFCFNVIPTRELSCRQVDGVPVHPNVLFQQSFNLLEKRKERHKWWPGLLHTCEAASTCCQDHAKNQPGCDPRLQVKLKGKRNHPDLLRKQVPCQLSPCITYVTFEMQHTTLTGNHW